ncbi:hypothetical protein EPUS_08562 [Endocarpon pusillum Z07020]|uniref:Uncharacterized protein n=1 Tax=Endocarpon pusillum (strain Z07020 / HMAS-L-300199) TaxID=1263415 RepID=U1HWJ2_ENDPU|nr:uncharacterized protein EPUS_08562 [Endocarpon pusillum Z07020]ERF73764.1 hypothetical protein EPUS_08562 [Endocarpon pusillum Z07020]
MVLSAMQLGASLPPLNTNGVFQQAYHGLVVFSVAIVAAVVSLGGMVFLSILLLNMVRAISHEKRARRQREKTAQEQKEMKEVLGSIVVPVGQLDQCCTSLENVQALMSS